MKLSLTIILVLISEFAYNQQTLENFDFQEKIEEVIFGDTIKRTDLIFYSEEERLSKIEIKKIKTRLKRKTHTTVFRISNIYQINDTAYFHVFVESFKKSKFLSSHKFEVTLAHEGYLFFLNCDNQKIEPMFFGRGYIENGKRIIKYDSVD